MIISASLVASDTYTSPVMIRPSSTNQGFFNLSISGTFVGTITTQFSDDGSTGWRDIDTYTAAAEKVGASGTDIYFRAGFKALAYTSGTAVVKVSQKQ